MLIQVDDNIRGYANNEQAFLSSCNILAKASLQELVDRVKALKKIYGIDQKIWFTIKASLEDREAEKEEDLDTVWRLYNANKAL